MFLVSFMQRDATEPYPETAERFAVQESQRSDDADMQSCVALAQNRIVTKQLIKAAATVET
jgi:hypothetical protein